MTSSASVLVVSPAWDRTTASARSLAGADLRVVTAESCYEARRALAGDPSIELVITSLSLSDGNWYSVLESSVVCGDRAAVVVAATEAGERFREVVRARGSWGVVETQAELAMLLEAMRGVGMSS